MKLGGKPSTRSTCPCLPQFTLFSPATGRFVNAPAGGGTFVSVSCSSCTPKLHALHMSQPSRPLMDVPYKACTLCLASALFPSLVVLTWRKGSLGLSDRHFRPPFQTAISDRHFRSPFQTTISDHYFRPPFQTTISDRHFTAWWAHSRP